MLGLGQLYLEVSISGMELWIESFGLGKYKFEDTGTHLTSIRILDMDSGHKQFTIPQLLQIVLF